ncbi:MAG: alkaline phosphatase family protein [Anaerolineales bacterium]
MRHLILILLAVLAACAPAPAALPADPTPRGLPTLGPMATATPQPSPTASPTVTVTPTGAPTLTPTPRPQQSIARVLIISIDGLRPDAIELAPMPFVQALLPVSAYSLRAQTIYPSSTLPSHASMLLGLCPAQHGVDWNDYLPQNGYASGQSIFSIAHAAGKKTIMIVGKEKLRQLTPPETLDVFRYINDRDTVIAAQAAPLLAQGFDLAFIHFALPDGMGHEYGWLSPEYLSVVRRSDESIAALFAALESAGLRETTMVIITADHGGHESTHGTRRAEDMTIPWIMTGPGVVPQQLIQPVSTTDTAATVLWALDLPLPPEMVGQPVREAWGEIVPPRLDLRCP